jgi:menaquinone-dependent protoporphyrinogen oxidase
MMAAKILVAYASKHGTTREVAESIAATLREHDLDVEIAEAAHVREIARYDAVVVGGGLYMGKWHSDAQHLLKRHRRELAEKRVAVFGMGPDSLEEAKVAESRKQLDRALAAIPELEPIAVAISVVRSSPRAGGSRSTSCRRSMRATGTRSTVGRWT